MVRAASRVPPAVDVLAARGLTKRYDGFLALDKVDFDVRRGEIVGYLGPNGSGKSTTVNLVVGLIEPSAGTISIDGRSLAEDPVAYKRGIGYVPEEPHLYTHLTATEYLTLAGRLRGIPSQTLHGRVTKLLQLLLLYDSRFVTMRAYSKGMRQRVLLAAALLHNPELLVLDEPFSGLDVAAGMLFRSLLTLLAAEGRMILFSTHRFDMVEKLCSRVVILSAGRIVAQQRIAAPDTRRPSALEELFVRATRQDDYAPIAREILVDTVIWSPFALMFTVAFGLKASFSLPVDRQANWVFRMTEGSDSRHEQLRVVERAMWWAAVTAPVLLLFPLQWLLLGPRALACVAVGVPYGLLFVELVLMGWQRIPFTCSYLPGKRFVGQTIVLGLAAFWFFGNVGAFLVRQGLGRPWRALLIIAVLTAIVGVLRGNRVKRWRETPLLFEDQFPDVVQRLGLTLH